MSSKSLFLVAAACLSTALASCGSGSAEFPGSEEGAVPDPEDSAAPNPEVVARNRAVAANAAKDHAADRVDAAAVAPTATAIITARAAINEYVAAAEAAVAAASRLQGTDANDQRAAAQIALTAARSYRDANQPRLNALEASLDENTGPEESATPSVRSRLTALRALTLTHLERGHIIRTNEQGLTGLLSASVCPESGDTCDVGGVQFRAENYFDSEFHGTSATAPAATAPINGVETFSDERTGDIPVVPPYISRSTWKLLALGQHSAVHVSALRSLRGSVFEGVTTYGAALGEQRGVPAGASGSATWRGQMVGAAMDNGAMLAGESALTYSFARGTVDVEISNIRAIRDIAPYTGSTSFTWNGLLVSVSGSNNGFFSITGHNNDRSRATLDSSLHRTEGYIDGDFYGPNAEESAGIFTRGNVNGAWVARRSGSDRQTEADENPEPEENAGPGENTQPEISASSLVRSGLTDLGARTLTHVERGYLFRTNLDGSLGLAAVFPCSESEGTCAEHGTSFDAKQHLDSAIFSEWLFSASVAAAGSINGVQAFSAGSMFELPTNSVGLRNVHSLALGRHSVAASRYSGWIEPDSSFSVGGTTYLTTALGERHNGRPAGASGSATWRGQMVGAAMDNGAMLAGESDLTYSFGTNTVDVAISNIRAVRNVAPYTGSTSFAWKSLSVNSDGSFYIPGYNNDRPGVAQASALHTTLGYIDGDFYGPNAEESAGVFIRDNVHGAWVAKK